MAGAADTLRSLWTRLARKAGDTADELFLDGYRDQIDQARTLAAGGEPFAAVEMLEALLREKPDHAAALTLLGALLLTLGQEEPAAAAFETALAARPGDPHALVGHGQALVARGQLDLAIEQLGRGVDSAGGDRGLLAAAYLALGQAWRALGDRDKAARDLRKAVAEAPDDPVARALLGDVLLADPRTSSTEARQHLERAAAADPAPPLALLSLGRLALDDGRAVEAGALFERAAAAALATHGPDGKRLLVAARLGLGDAAVATRDFLLAHQRYLEALELEPRRATIHARLAALAAGRGDTHAALLAYDRALALADRAAADRAAADRAAADRAAADRTAADRATADRTAADRAADDRATADRTAADRAAADRATADRTAADRSAADRSAADRSAADRSAADRSAADRSAADRSAADRSAADRSAAADRALDDELAILTDAVAAAHVAGDRERAVRWANDLLARDPSSPIALAARAEEMRSRGSPAAARALVAGMPPHVELVLVESRAAADLGDLAAATAAAQTALELAPALPRARDALADALARTVAVPDDDDVTRLADALARALATRADLAPLVAAVSRATAELEQPLLVTVMGEFSSGKSSFVNAFIGADVAATGITPTTATINVVKYGHARGGRILHHDGSARRPAWDELHGALRALTPEAAAAVDRVEITLPLDELARVHIIDTPGLNSILPEHEATARAFIARADAVVWVFTAGQGGKASERKALDAIHAEGKRVLGVLNKRDQLSASDVAEVITHVASQLGDRVETIVPFSARAALAWKRAGAPATSPPGSLASTTATSSAHPPGSVASHGGGVSTGSSSADAGSRTTIDDGGWTALSAALETRFFTQARSIKRAAVARRLLATLATARTTVERARAAAQDAAAGQRTMRDHLLSTRDGWDDAVVGRERRTLAAAVGDLYAHAAREVIELVRPRQLPFGSHTATAADRDYLVALLSDGYEAMLRAAADRIAADVRAALGLAFAATPAQRDRAIRGATEPLEFARAYVAGFLAGGAVDSFFRNDLPRLALEPETVRHALFRSAPDLEVLVADPLARAGQHALADAADAIDRLAQRHDVLVYTFEIGLERAFDTLAARLGA